MDQFRKIRGFTGTFSFTLARAISSFHLCCSESSRLLLILVRVCWSSLFSLLILSTSAGVNFWFFRRCCSSSCSCFRDSRWLAAKWQRQRNMVFRSSCLINRFFSFCFSWWLANSFQVHYRPLLVVAMQYILTGTRKRPRKIYLSIFLKTKVP